MRGVPCCEKKKIWISSPNFVYKCSAFESFKQHFLIFGRGVCWIWYYYTPSGLEGCQLNIWKNPQKNKTQIFQPGQGAVGLKSIAEFVAKSLKSYILL